MSDAASDPPASVPVPPPPGDEARLEPLLELVRSLRAPGGCPWDRKQTLRSVRAYLLEEAHEAAAALDAGDPQALAGELGDLLFQVAFVGVLLEETGAPGLDASIRQVHRKMVRRHPHVFADAEKLADADAVARAWEKDKEQEKEREQDGRRQRDEAEASAGTSPGASGSDGSHLDGVPETLPALVASYRLTQKAAGVGFDWPDVGGVVAKVREELAEVEEHLGDGGDRQALEEELGDLLFAVANLARHLDLDPEAALAACNRKFRRRFRRVEEGLRRRGRSLAEAELEEMDALWEESKDDDR